MATISITKGWADGDILLEADLDAIKSAVETFLNTTKINDDNIQTSGITASSKLIDASISTAKIASDAVTTEKILDSNITTAKIASDAVTTAKILDANVTKAKLATAARDPTADAKSADFTAELTKDNYNVTTSGGVVTATLPAAASSSGHEFTFTKYSSTNSLVIDGNASETINGATTLTLYDQYETVTIWCDGTEWLIRNKYVPGSTVNPLIVAASRGSTLSLPDSTWVNMIYSTETTDNKSAYDHSTGTFTCPAGYGGEYIVSARAYIDSSGGISWTTGESAQIAYEINSSGKVLMGINISETTSGADNYIDGIALVTLAAADTLKFHVYQTSSQTAGVAASSGNRMFITRVR